MPAFNVSETIRINRPIDQVHQAIADFNTWPAWSPWLCMEPEASVDCHGQPGSVGHGYSWEGKKVGAGEMQWREVTPTESRAHLTFLKPFKSKADVGFNLTSVGEHTDVEWVMDSSLPFFMFFMVSTMKGMISMDYSRGLEMLKDYVETGQVPSKIATEGQVNAQPFAYVGVSNKASMRKIGPSMEAAFNEVAEKMAHAGVESYVQPVSIYNNMDVRRGECHYTAAIPVDEGAPNIDGLAAGKVAGGACYKVVHTGPYRHLGNAWATAMSDMRHLKLKASKQSKPYERYLNDPANTAENDLVTEIFVPIR